MKRFLITPILLAIIPVAMSARRLDIYTNTKKDIQPAVVYNTQPNKTASTDYFDVDNYNRRNKTVTAQSADVNLNDIVNQSYIEGYNDALYDYDLDFYYSSNLIRFHAPSYALALYSDFDLYYDLRFRPWRFSFSIYDPWYYDSWYYNPWYYDTWYYNSWRYDPWYYDRHYHYSWREPYRPARPAHHAHKPEPARVQRPAEVSHREQNAYQRSGTLARPMNTSQRTDNKPAQQSATRPATQQTQQSQQSQQPAQTNQRRTVLRLNNNGNTTSQSTQTQTRTQTRTTTNNSVNTTRTSTPVRTSAPASSPAARPAGGGGGNHMSGINSNRSR